MSRQKIWYSKILKIPGVPPEVTGSASGKMSNRIAWALKHILTQSSGFAPEGIPSSASWSTYSSSAGEQDLGRTLNGDRWVLTSNTWGAADSLPRAANGSAHSWCILKAPPQFAFDETFGSDSKKEFYLNIDLNTASSSGVNSFTFSYDEPLTPTLNYNSPMSMNTSLTSYWGWDATSAGSNTRTGSNLLLMQPLDSDTSRLNLLSQEDIYLNVTVANDGSFYAAARSAAPWHPFYLWVLICVKIPYTNFLDNPLAGFSSGINSQHNVYTFMSNWQARGNATSINVEEGFSMLGPGGLNSSGLSGNSAGHKSKKLGFYDLSRGSNSAVLTSTVAYIGYNTVDLDKAFYKREQFENSGQIISHPFIIAETSVTESGSVGVSAITQRAIGTSPITAVIPDFYIAPGAFKSNHLIESDGDNYITIGQIIAPISTGVVPF